MSTVFCCSSISPYRPARLDHEAKFDAFMQWANLQTTSLVPGDGSSLVSSAPYAIQLVRQVNYGPQESIRYFVPTINGFGEVTEDDLLNLNFNKVNSYKNYRCEKHNKFFEINLYQKNPINAHHWRATLARPSRDIDLAYIRKKDDIREKPSDQEDNRELFSSDIQGKPSFPKPHSSLSKTVQEANEAAPQKIQPANQPDIESLKRVLRFLLPTVGRSLGSSSLLSLLSLDWANAELDLGLDFENLWEAELTSSNIIIFFCDCFASYDASAAVQVNLAEVEDLVIPAMRHVESHKGQQFEGRVKLHEIVNKVLESGRPLDWVSVYGGSITRVFTSGPGKELLEQCQRKDDQLQQDRSNRNTEEVHGIESEKDNEEFVPWTRRNNYNDYDLDYNHDDDSDYGHMKDLTACDKECGYCGNCDY